jgi:hypothetical protein
LNIAVAADPAGTSVDIIRPGDRVCFERDENHWHGAAPNRFMVHLGMQQNDEHGSRVTRDGPGRSLSVVHNLCGQLT